MHRDWSVLGDHKAAEGQGPHGPCPCGREEMEYDVWSGAAFCNGNNCPPVPDLSLSPEIVQRLAEVFGIVTGADDDKDGLKAEVALKNLIEEVSKIEPSKSHFIHHPEMEPSLIEASDQVLKKLDNMSDAELLSELESCDSTIAYAVNPEFNDDTPIQGGENPFAPTILAGKAAERFLRHMKEDGPNPLAQASLERGRKLIAEMEQNGFVNLK